MTLGQLLEEGVGILTDAGVEDAVLDARTLLLETFDMDISRFLAVRRIPLIDHEENQAGIRAYRELIRKRALRIPLQQLTGVQGFMGLDFMVNEHVLIPRQDTETLVELVLEEHKGRKARVLDLCTGSGCIAISLAVLGGFQVTALDLSEEALKVAERNRQALLPETEEEGTGSVRLLHSDMFEQVPEGETFDIITSNPPYIPAGVIETLEPEVRDHEPRMALDGDWDGMRFYRILAQEAWKYLKPGGALYLEIGHDQADLTGGYLEHLGYREVRTIKDLAGNDRVVAALWKG